MADKRRIMGLVRVSTHQQAEHGGSIDDQLQRLRGWVEDRGDEWVGHYGEGDRSGQSQATSPDFVRMLEDAAGDLWDAVVVESCDRFRRNFEDAVVARGTLRRAGRGLHILDVMSGQDLTADDENGAIAFTLLSFVAEQEGKRFKARGRKSHRTKLARGRWNGGPPPYGYRYSKELAGEVAQLVKDEGEGEAAALMWRLALDGWPTHRIARDLTQRGFRPRKGAEQFGQPSVSNVLRNPVYAGHGHAYDSSERSRVNARKDRPKRLEGVLGAQGDWEPYVSVDDWKKVQALLQGRRNNFTARGGRPSKFLFTQGMIKCLHCGNSLWTRSDGAGTYHCSSRKLGVDCSFRPIKREQLDGAVREFICDDARLLDYDEGLRRVTAATDADHELVSRRIETTRLEIDRLDIELQALAGGEMTSTTNALFERKQVAQSDKQDLLADLERERVRIAASTPSLEETTAIMEALRQSFLDPNADDVDALRDTLRRAFKTAAVEQLDDRGKKFKIHFAPTEEFYRSTMPDTHAPMHVPDGSLVGETQPTACR